MLPYIIIAGGGFIVGIVVCSFIYERPPLDDVRELLQKKRRG